MAKKDVDAYISAQAEPERTLLKQMRQIIMEVEPSLKQVMMLRVLQQTKKHTKSSLTVASTRITRTTKW